MSDEDEDAWDRVLFHLENQTGFWLGLVAGDDARSRAELQEKARAFWEGEGRAFVLHEPAPGKSRALAVELTRQDAPALHWISVDGEVGDEGAAELVLAMNERREAYRSRLDGGVVIEGRASLKRMVRELAPDLFSIRAFVVEPEGAPAVETIERPEWRLQLHAASEGAALSDPDRELDRASRLAGIDGHGAMMARFEALTRAVEALTDAGRFPEATLWAEELALIAEQWSSESSPQQERRRALSLAKAFEVRGSLLFCQNELEGEEEFDAAIPLYELCGDRLNQADCIVRRGYARLYRKEESEAVKDFDAAILLYKALGDRSGQAHVLRALGHLEVLRNNPASAREWYEQSLRLYRTFESGLVGVRIVLAELADVCAQQGEKASAERLATEALQLSSRSEYASELAAAVLGRIRQPI